MESPPGNHSDILADFLRIVIHCPNDQRRHSDDAFLQDSMPIGPKPKTITWKSLNVLMIITPTTFRIILIILVYGRRLSLSKIKSA